MAPADGRNDFEITFQRRVRSRLVQLIAARTPRQRDGTPDLRCVICSSARIPPITRLALTREVEQFSERLRATDHRDTHEIEQHREVEPKKF